MNLFQKIHIHQVLISLLLGAVIGASWVQWRDHGCFMKPRDRDAMRQHMIEKLERKLDLNAEQRAQLEAIFEAKRPQMKAIRSEMRPKLDAVRKETREEIRKILNPDQLVKYEELNRKMDEHWKKMRKDKQW